MFVDALLSYVLESTIVSIAIFALLSFYFIAIIWVFLYRYLSLVKWNLREERSLRSLFRGKELDEDSILSKCVSEYLSKEMLKACKNTALKKATSGLTFLSIVASTSPFIGLFGTVVGILETFAEFENQTKVSLNIIAPAISEALVATALGIFVAIPAYSFHLILKRKSFELDSTIQTEIDLVLSKKAKEESDV